jgi:hypothetical protein
MEILHLMKSQIVRYAVELSNSIIAEMLQCAEASVYHILYDEHIFIEKTPLMNLKINIDSCGHFEVFVREGTKHRDLAFHSPGVTHGIIIMPMIL